MTPLELTAQGVDAVTTQRSASPNITAEELRSLGVAWKAVFDHRGGSGNGATDARREEGATTHVVQRGPTEPPPLHDSDRLPATAAQIRGDVHEKTPPDLRLVDARSPPTGTRLRDVVREVEPVPTALLPRTADESVADEPSRPSYSSVELYQPQAGDSVTVAVLDGAVDIVVRDASLNDETALSQAFDVAARLNGRRVSLRRVTLNGHDLYIRDESAPVPAQASLLFCC